MLLTESADNFISASRDDFVDPRFRSVSIADVFPDGYRRWLANNLTGDDSIKGVYARGTGGTGPQPADLDPNGYALLGQTSWWPTPGIETCFPQAEKLTCRDPFSTTAIGPAQGVGPTIDPQVGWEQQKFLIVNTLMYLPENGKLNWLDQLRIWELGTDSDPGFASRITFEHPSGRRYVAKAYPPETKKKMDALVVAVEAALKDDIAGLDWMTPATKEKALAKLGTIVNKVGYPEKWRDYSTVKIDRKDLVGSIRGLPRDLATNPKYMEGFGE